MRIAISTSGGDAPGLNAVLRGAATAAVRRGHQIYGIRHGFSGLLEDDELVPLTEERVEGIERTGGTILGAASKGSPFDPEGRTLARLRDKLGANGIEALILAGGDGTLQIAAMLHEGGLKVVSVPKTIDRDVAGTWTTFGFDSAVNTATEAIDKLHSTTASHNRLMVVEVMGRDAGWIALYAGMGGGAHMIALPELPYDVERFAEHVRSREAAGCHYHILVASEGARPRGGEAVVHGRTGRYGGVAEHLASELGERTGKESRALSLGHLLRGGAPTVFDRVLGLRFGSAAVSALDRGESGVMIAFQPPGFVSVPYEAVSGRLSLVGPDSPELRTAGNLGISFGV